MSRGRPGRPDEAAVASSGAAPQARPRCAVIDYGAGNMVSITQGLRAAGAEVVSARSPDALEGADALVVPGVGAAAAAMMRLRRYGFVEPIRAWVEAGRPYLGICLGFQLLFERSEEGNAKTLGLLPGWTRRLVDAPTLPHIGWNSVERRRESSVLDEIPDGAHFYFVHSYAPAPEDRTIVLAETTHGRPFASAVASGSLVGVQFHPERSSLLGLRLLSNFLATVPPAVPSALPAVAAEATGARC